MPLGSWPPCGREPTTMAFQSPSGPCPVSKEIPPPLEEQTPELGIRFHRIRSGLHVWPQTWLPFPPIG